MPKVIKFSLPIFPPYESLPPKYLKTKQTPRLPLTPTTYDFATVAQNISSQTLKPNEPCYFPYHKSVHPFSEKQIYHPHHTLAV